MTGEDHDDALIAALRSPALPSEHVGEATAVTAMLDALPATPARPAGRQRRGVAIAAVSIASLGIGGLVAAGPGAFFSPAADRAPAPSIETDAVGHTDADTTVLPSSTLLEAAVDEMVVDEMALDEMALDEMTDDDGGAGGTSARTIDAPAIGSDETDCDDNHGQTVADVARSTVPRGEERGAGRDEVVDTARSECGKPDPARPQSPTDAAPGRSSATPADTAPGRTGDTPADTAPGRIGDTPADTAPGRTDDTPADTAPGQTGRPDAAPERTDADEPAGPGHGRP